MTLQELLHKIVEFGEFGGQLDRGEAHAAIAEAYGEPPEVVEAPAPVGVVSTEPTAAPPAETV